MYISFVRRISAASLVFTCCSLPLACGSNPDPEDDPPNAAESTTSSTSGAPEEPADACDAEHTMLAPTDGAVASFADAASSAGRLLAFPFDDETAPTYDVRDGALHVSVDTPTTADAQYLGVVIGFETACVDASAFQGVEFSIGGSLSGCSLAFGAGDAGHQDIESGAPRAEGPVGAFQPQTWIADTMDSTDDQTLRVPFRQQLGGNPNTPIDPSELILMLWQLNVPEGTGDERCVADLRIDEVRFYRADD